MNTSPRHFTPNEAQCYLDGLPDSTCDCPECQNMCRFPCWPTPAEAQCFIESGYGDQLMLEWWEGDENTNTFFILAPASQGREEGIAPAAPNKPCVFFVKGYCVLHGKGLKPTEGRKASCQPEQNPPRLHEAVAMLWNTPQAQAIVTDWTSKQNG